LIDSRYSIKRGELGQKTEVKNDGECQKQLLRYRNILAGMTHRTKKGLSIIAQSEKQQRGYLS